MKKVITTLILSFAFPVLALAAFDDVQIGSGVTITANSRELVVTSGSLQALEADSTEVRVTTQGGSSLRVTNSARADYTLSGAASKDCQANQSVVEVSSGAGSGVGSATIAPLGSTCSTQASGSGDGESTPVSSTPVSSGGGGGATPSSVSTPTPTPTSAPATTVAVAPVTPATTVAKPSPVAQVVSPVFNKDLQVGARNDDVRRLQELLAKDKSIYPEGLMTGYFGPATQRAVRKFQAKYGLPQVGRVGPLTREKLEEAFKVEAPAPVPESTLTTPAPTVTQQQVDVQVVQSKISALQKVLLNLMKQLQALLQKKSQ